MRRLPSLDDLDIAGRRVLVRADLNVPLNPDGQVADDTRLKSLAPTIDEIVKRGGRPIVLSHFGRPKGRPDPAFSLRAVVPALEKVLGRPVVFAEDCIGPPAHRVIEALGEGEVAVLENTRFHAGEQANDIDFAACLADLGDVYVMDAFSVAHRANASTDALARLLPSAAGPALIREVDALERALATPAHPVAAIVGGAKISTKLGVLGHLTGKVDQLVIGGGMANTFLNALGKPVGKSLCEHELADTARTILAQAETAGCEIALPIDVTVAPELAANVPVRRIAIDDVAADDMILDIGPQTVTDLIQRLESCRTLVWNGPLGTFETPPFDGGTTAVAQAAARLTDAGSLLSVAGGGDTVAALNRAGVADRFSHVSTAGGAFLEWLEGKDLPGIKALTREK